MAFTETKVFITTIGNKTFGCYKLTGDGSDTTFTAPIGTVDAAWFQRLDDTATSELLSWATNIITFAEAPANTKFIYIFFVGSA